MAKLDNFSFDRPTFIAFFESAIKIGDLTRRFFLPCPKSDQPKKLSFFKAKSTQKL